MTKKLLDINVIEYSIVIKSYLYYYNGVFKSYFHIENILKCLKIHRDQIERRVHWPLVSGKAEGKNTSSSH